MNQQKIDHRVRVTHTLLKEALYRLIMNRSIQDITIKELCLEANINRTTFYSHFQSVQELVETLENEVWVELLVLLKRSEKDSAYFNNQIFFDVFQMAHKYHQLFSLLLNKNADPYFVEKVFNLGRSVFKSSFKRSKTLKDETKVEYYYISVLNAFIGILQLWINNQMKESPEEMAEITKSIINRGIRFILEDQG